jgi:hypothetical protein
VDAAEDPLQLQFRKEIYNVAAATPTMLEAMFSDENGNDMPDEEVKRLLFKLVFTVHEHTCRLAEEVERLKSV